MEQPSDAIAVGATALFRVPKSLLMISVPARLRLAIVGGALLAIVAGSHPAAAQLPLAPAASAPPSQSAPPLQSGEPLQAGERLPADEPGVSSEAGTLPPEPLEIEDAASMLADQRAAEDRLYNELAAEVEALERMSHVVRQVAKLVRPRVVHVEASKVENTQGRSEAFDEAGSGILLTHRGATWVLTNRHVIAGAQPAEITLRLGDGRVLVPTRVLSDPSTDVAILAVEDPQLGATRIGNSDRVAVGDFVLAVGSPFGLSHSVTFGIISATGRRDLTLGNERIELQDFFQTDAAINPGNSGGPLLNLRGEVIALNTAIASSSGGSEGIGFAIPINMVMRVVDQLIEYGRVRRAYLGVTLDPDFQPGDALQLGLPRSGGALVKAVNANSPAATAGIANGDVITSFDGVPIDNDDHLVTRVGLTPIGKTVEVVLYRSGRSYQTTVTVAPYPG